MNRDDVAGAQVVGAVILFGLFVTIVAFLNVTAVPEAGLAAEEEHHASVLDAMNALQTSAEAAAIPGKEGATVATSIPLGPPQRAGSDFLSFFLAKPVRASGQIGFDADYGNVTVTHLRHGSDRAIVDVGSVTERFPYGRVTFDPHAHFTTSTRVHLENGATVTERDGHADVRFDPPVTVAVVDGDTHVGIKVRVLDGTAFGSGGLAPVRLSLETEAATLHQPRRENAAETTLRIETAHGSAWARYLNETSERAGLRADAGFVTTMTRGVGDALDVVTWTVRGVGSGNDVRLTTGVAVYEARLG